MTGCLNIRLNELGALIDMNRQIAASELVTYGNGIAEIIRSLSASGFLCKANCHAERARRARHSQQGPGAHFSSRNPRGVICSLFWQVRDLVTGPTYHRIDHVLTADVARPF